MNNKGITLIELVVVVTIIGILVAALGFTFQAWAANYNIESQTKTLYMDLMNSRARAMQRNRSHFVVVSANNYQVIEDTNESGTKNAGDTTVGTTTLNYPSLWTGTVTMDNRGLVSPNNTLRFDVGTNTPDYDCIVLFATRINMGKLNTTTEKCDAK